MVEAAAAAKPVEGEVLPPADETPVDVFAQAFEQITSDAEPPVEKPAEETPPAETPPAETPPAETPPAETPPVEKPVAKPVEPAAGEDILSRLAGLLQKGEGEPETRQPEEPVNPYSPEETASIESYLKDFPDVAKAEAIIRRGEYKAITSYIFAEVQRGLQPLMQTVRTLSERTHLGDIQTAVPDYGNVRDKVVEWTQTQPAYLKAAYDHVIKNGTVDEVADLIRRYQKETGTAAPATGSAAAAAAKVQPELTPAAQKAVAALAPIGSKRSATVVGADPADFSSAFDQFAKAG